MHNADIENKSYGISPENKLKLFSNEIEFDDLKFYSDYNSDHHF